MSDSRCAKVRWLRFNGCQAEIEAAQVEFGAHLLFKRHKKKKVLLLKIKRLVVKLSAPSRLIVSARVYLISE